MNLHWLPAADDFRTKLKAASQIQDPVARLESLARLSRHQLDSLQTIQIGKLMGDAAAALPEGWSVVRLALLASHTFEHLVPGIRVAGLRRNIFVETYICGYGQYRQELSDQGSGLRAFNPQFVFLAIAAQELLQANESASAVRDFIVGLRGLWKLARQDISATVIQQTFVDTSEPLFGNFDQIADSSPARTVQLLNHGIAEAAREDGVLLLDLSRQVALHGRDNWFDVSHWYSSKLMIAPRAAPLFGDQLLRVMAARLGVSKKCLVLDLDNTIWGGVVGDDGVQGLVLGPGSAAGKAHLALQRYAKQLSERGVILAVCSKNERATAEEAFTNHPEMLLKMPDIAAFVANWTDKAENLRGIASQLNIGLDSLVFVDDNPAERQRIRGALPQVSVPELPDDVAGYVRSIADGGYFESVSYTAEDRARVEQYAANNERQALRDGTQSLDDFRRSLGMTMQFGPFVPVDLARISQLINKTNQFNVTVRRFAQQEIEAIAADQGYVTLQFRLGDRFGDNGLISAVICRQSSASTLLLESWVMSCRVFGRDLELEIMNSAVAAARTRGVRSIETDYVRTTRNGLIGELLPRLGFIKTGTGVDGDMTSRWILNVADYVWQNTHIQPEAQ